MPGKLAPAERVERLRLRYGSHDKLAYALGTTRQRIIRWEQGGGISPGYAEKLAELDHSEPDAFRPQRPGPQFQSLRREVEQVLAEVRALRSDFDETRAELEAQGLRVRAARRGRRA